MNTQIAAALSSPPKHDRSALDALLGELKEPLGERCVTSAAVREQHAHTLTWIANQPPDAVVFPLSTDEVSAIVKLCAEARIPIIPFGAGTSLEGHVNAPHGGICLDMSRMKRIVAINDEDLNVVVEAGVTRKELNSHLRDKGLFFPIDPGADASIGGMASTRASGTNAVLYGTMKDNVLAVTAVMPNGRVVKTAQPVKKTSAGYDLTRLLIGAEGTLGIITELTLKLYGIPETIMAAICSFPTARSACDATIYTIQSGLSVARIELLDAVQVKAVNAYSKLTLPESPLLLLEFHGSEAGVREQIEQFRSIAEECGGDRFEWAEKPEDRNRLWQARHDVHWASQTLRPGARITWTDVCVPISRLAECMDETRLDMEASGLIGPIVGHVGDGNFHTGLLIMVDDPDKISNAERYLERLAERAIRMNGTCTGEHGIGQGKIRYLEAELGADTVEVMRVIKRSLDPENIINPGKIFRL